jgi:hypothetical protein
VVVAITLPFAFVERSELGVPDIANDVVVAPVVVMFWKEFVPENVLLSLSNVDDAAKFPIHVPCAFLKQPPLSWMPFVNVDVPEVTLSAVVWIPPANVEVPGFVTARFVIVVVPAERVDESTAAPVRERVPWRMVLPVVVAPPYIVRPVPCVPDPIVVEAAKMFVPLQRFESERSVDEAAVIVMDDPALKVVPLMVPREPLK